ncbi:MAG: nickel-dependent hydrogenase large subunit [Methanomassiliicoccales archaeon]|jgi:NADH-quinone oxidoreductase subunit D
MTEMWVNMGPQHPFNHGLWNLRVKLDGEKVTDAEPVIGYLHRGWEKMVENRDYQQIIPMSDRLCYCSALTWSHVYVSAVEKLMEVEVPERAQWVRVITIEIQRLASHLMWLAAVGTDLGSYTIFLYAMRERELFLDLLTNLTGARLTYNYMRIGGVRNDFPDNFERDTLRACDLLEKRIKGEYYQLMDQNSPFRMRTIGTGVLSKEDAMNLGVTGPNMRGSNVDFDLRRDDPYEKYDELDFEVCVEKDGDSFARYRVRMREMLVSCDIIRDAFKKIREGPVRVKTPKNAPVGTAFAHVEDPRGESLMYVMGDGTNHPYRLKVRSPIFVTVSAAPKMVIGYKMADIPAIMGTVDMCVGETDR